MESDAKTFKEGLSDADIVSLSALSLDLENIPDLAFNVKKDITKVLQDLKRYEKNPKKGCSCIDRLWNISSNSKDNIAGVIAHVNENNYPQSLISMIEGVKSSGYFSSKPLGSSDLWNTSRKLFDCVCLFSKYSEEFCNNLVVSGITWVLEDNLKQFEDLSVLRDKNSRPFFIVKATLCVVKNLAKNVCGERIALRKCFLSHLNHLRMIEELNVFATIGALFLCNRSEAQIETVSKDTVPCLVYWVNQSFQAFNDPTSWYAMYNLQDATDAIWILANFGNSDRFCESIVLLSFHEIIKTASLPEQIQTLEIIWVLCFNSQFEEFIKNDKIVKTMRLKERNDKNPRLLRRLNAVLTILRERFFPRSISFEGYEASSDSVARIVYHAKDVDAARKLSRTLRNENVSADINDPGENDPKYFETVVSWMHKCYCVIFCVSEFTENDYESRTILYVAHKLHKDVIVVFVKQNIHLNGWVYQSLQDKPCFDFMESPFYAKDLAKLLIEKSISFSRKTHVLRNTRSLGSFTTQSKLSVLSDSSSASVTSLEKVFPPVGEIGKQDSSESTICTSLQPLSISSNPTTRPSLLSPMSPNTPSSVTSGGWFENPELVSIPEKFKTMKKNDVSEWLKSLNIGINIRNFRNVNGSLLWELATACQISNPSDEKSYDSMMEQFNLTREQQVKFTDALLKL